MNTVNCFELRGSFVVHFEEGKGKTEPLSLNEVRIWQTYETPFLRIFYSANDSTDPLKCDLVILHNDIKMITDAAGGVVWQ